MIAPKLVEYLEKVIHLESENVYPQERYRWYLEGFDMKDLVAAIADTPEFLDAAIKLMVSRGDMRHE